MGNKSQDNGNLKRPFQGTNKKITLFLRDFNYVSIGSTKLFCLKKKKERSETSDIDRCVCKDLTPVLLIYMHI